MSSADFFMCREPLNYKRELGDHLAYYILRLDSFLYCVFYDIILIR